MELIEKIKNNLKWIIALTCILLFIILMILVIKNEVLTIDTRAIDLVVNYIRKDWLTKFFKFFTFFGEAKLLIPVGCIGACIGFFIIKDRLRASCYFTNLAAVGVMNWIIKHIIQRPRPDLNLRLVEEDGYSFPSGHAMISTAFYGLAIYYLWNHISNKLLRNLVCFGLAILIVMIDFSRVYLGVHYLSDVISGSLISVGYLIIAIEFARKFIFKEEENTDK